MNTLGLYGFISLFAHLTVATGWAFFHSWEHHRQSLARSWGCRCTNEPQPSPAEPDPGQQNCPDEPRPQRNPGLTPCVLLASGWATGTRLVAFPPVEWGYELLPPCPVLSHHPSFFAMCLQGMPQAMLHFRPRRHVVTIPEMMSVKCHVFQEERHSPEGTWGVVMITAPLWRDHGYLAWSHHLLWWQLLPGCMYTCDCRLFCFTWRLPWAAASTACSSAGLWRARVQRRAGARILELSVGVYSFGKYLLSVYSEPNMRLDIAGV